MKKLFICCVAYLFVITFVFAGDEHDHTGAGFENTEVFSKFELSNQQIENLNIKTQIVKLHKFYTVVEANMVIKKIPNYGIVGQGFIMEGKDLLEVKTRQNVEIKIDSISNKIFKGKIVSIDEMIDPISRLFSVYAKINGNFPKIGNGLKGKMIIKTSPIEEVIGIPKSAIQGEFGDYFVFIMISDNAFEKRNVILGHETGDFVEIINGVKEGEKVVTNGSYQLKYAKGTLIEEENKDEKKEDKKIESVNKEGEEKNV